MNNLKIKQIQIKSETLTHVLSKMLSTNITHASYQTKQLQGGTLGDVRLVTGVAETINVCLWCCATGISG